MKGGCERLNQASEQRSQVCKALSEQLTSAPPQNIPHTPSQWQVMGPSSVPSNLPSSMAFFILLFVCFVLCCLVGMSTFASSLSDYEYVEDNDTTTLKTQPRSDLGRSWILMERWMNEWLNDEWPGATIWCIFSSRQRQGSGDLWGKNKLMKLLY